MGYALCERAPRSCRAGIVAVVRTVGDAGAHSRALASRIVRVFGKDFSTVSLLRRRRAAH